MRVINDASATRAEAVTWPRMVDSELTARARLTTSSSKLLGI